MTPNDNQVALPELPEWNGEFMTESEFAEAAKAYALEAVRMNQPASGEAVAWPEEELIALVAGPYVYHHKMDDAATREGSAFDRCRDLTIQNIRTWCAMQRAVGTTPQAAQVQPPAEKPVAWWNGISEDKTERSPYGPSIRWGADAENSGHDIPMYAGYNPVHFAHPAADTLGAVRELVAKWRAMAPLCKTLGYGEAMRENADVLESTLAQAPAENAAAKHWHDLYRKECQLRQDDAARYGQQIIDLETKAPAVRVTDEMVRLAEGVRENSIRAIAAYGSAGVGERYRMSMRAALEAALGQGKAS